MRALRRSHRLGLQQVSQQAPQPPLKLLPQQLVLAPQPLLQQLVVGQLLQLLVVVQLLQPLLQQLVVAQQLDSQQHLLRWKQALSFCKQLGLQQHSISQPQPPPQPLLAELPPQQPLDTGAEATEPTAVPAGAAVGGAGSAPANHAVVTSKNAAFTRVILRWSLNSAEGHRALAGSNPIRWNWRPEPSSSIPHQRACLPHGEHTTLISDNSFRLARFPHLSSFPKNLRIRCLRGKSRPTKKNPPDRCRPGGFSLTGGKTG
jgi:hypothetical protein